MIQEGPEAVKQILSKHYVRPEEAEEVKSRIRSQGNYTIIDKVTVWQLHSHRPQVRLAVVAIPRMTGRSSGLATSQLFRRGNGLF